MSNLDGMIFAITGTLSMKRAEFVELIEENGGVVKGSVTKDVTHLISAKDDTAKAKKAKENGVKILKEEDVMKLVNGEGGGDDNEEDDDEEEKKADDEEEEEEGGKEEEEEGGDDDDNKQGLDGMVFAITGSLSMKRADFVALIEKNGGVVKGSVTKDVTHLISAKDDTAKAKKAKESGVKIVKEEDVMKMMKSGGGGAKEDDEEEENEEEEEEEEAGGGDGEGLDGMVFAITGTLSMKRADFVSMIEEHGGVVKGSVTKEVTHLISAKDDTAKAKKAKENGIKVLKEEDVMKLVGKDAPEPAKKKAKK